MLLFLDNLEAKKTGFGQNTGKLVIKEDGTHN
jgi:hypothetical protein